ncbi:hypothetical protein C8R43DRAFT_1133603 [Mycena crocata]|nr:hypothetical protein C8R43DRAFT_1133603 [Mycena crocata]
MDESVPRPRWPAMISTAKELADYTKYCSPISLRNAEFRQNFLPPKVDGPARDNTMYTISDGLWPFRTIIFGRVRSLPVVDTGRCSLTLHCPADSDPALVDAFGKQLLVLAAPVGEADDLDCDGNANIQSYPWTDSNRVTRSGGRTMTVLLYHGNFRCLVYTPATPLLPDDDLDELEVFAPRQAERYPIAVGDWVVFVATLHVMQIRDRRFYDIRAHHLRVLPASFTGVSVAAPTVTAAATATPTPALVASESNLQTQTPRKRNREVLEREPYQLRKRAKPSTA